MDLKTLKLTTLTLLSVLTIIVGGAIIYVSTRNTAEILTGLGVAFIEMGLLGILYEKVIKKVEKDKEEEEEQLERMEGRSCITNILSLSLDVDIEKELIEIDEREEITFLSRKQFSPLIYLDALKITGHLVNRKPRVEAYLEIRNRTINKYILINENNIKNDCKIIGNSYICKKSANIPIEKRQRATLRTIRRYKLEELTENKEHIVFNRQIWRPTNEIEVIIPKHIKQKYKITIDIIDYNGDLVVANIIEIEGSNQTKYTISLHNQNGRKRFYIMDKIIINLQAHQLLKEPIS